MQMIPEIKGIYNFYGFYMNAKHVNWKGTVIYFCFM